MLADRTRALLARLEKTPLRVRLTHPRTGIAEDVSVNAALSPTSSQGLYSPVTSALIPELIRRAEANDFQGLLALGLVGERAAENLSLGHAAVRHLCRGLPAYCVDTRRRANRRVVSLRVICSGRG